MFWKVDILKKGEIAMKSEKLKRVLMVVLILFIGVTSAVAIAATTEPVSSG